MPFKILNNKALNPQTCKLTLQAEEVAKKIQPGQFIILRLDEKAERIPLTVCQADPKQGTIDLIIQKAGISTGRLFDLKSGSYIQDLIGPLGKPSPIKKYGKVICIGGGVGIAELYPVAAGLKDAGNELDVIIGSRNKQLLILEDELRIISDQLLICTDDGSYGNKGNVVDLLFDLLQEQKFDIVFAVGPVLMMREVARLTKKYSLKTIVSLNSIMVDGTGMCGSCRITIDNKVRFVCVDGPDFDAHQVDFDELILRQNRFIDQECSQGEHKKCH
jgi:ferredoxin--NADP+ reductase